MAGPAEFRQSGSGSSGHHVHNLGDGQTRVRASERRGLAKLTESPTRMLAGALAVVAAVALPVTFAQGATGPSPVAVAPYTGFNAQLTRVPYLTDLTSSSVSVTWATTASAPGTLEWGPAGNCLANRVAAPSVLPTLVPTSESPATATGRAFTVGTVHEYQTTVPLAGLTPGTTYCYRVLSGGTTPVDLLGTNSSPTFTTLDPAGPAAVKPLTFDVIDDLGETQVSPGVDSPNHLNANQAAVDSLIGTSGARFLIDAGDTAYPAGNQLNYGDLQQTGTDVSDIFGPSYWPKTGGIPTFKSNGDHGQTVVSLRNWPESTTAAATGGTYGLDAYPASATDGTSAVSNADTWYAVQSGNVRIYMLDAAWNESSNLGTATGAACGAVGSSAAQGCKTYQIDYDKHWTTASPEYKWLAADLAAHPGGVKLAVFHYPLRSDNATQPSDVYLQNSGANPNQATSLEALLANNGVKLTFSGHAHTYQRIAPTASGQVVSYVTGGGGGILEPVLGGSTCTALQKTEAIYALGWSPTKATGSSCGASTPLSAAQVFNFLKVTVSGTTVTVSPVNAAGQVFDQQTYAYATAPDTSFTPPPSPVTSARATFSFQSIPTGATFRCTLDGGAAAPCVSPVTYTGLTAGAHTLAVAASNGQGTDPTPATAHWTVDTTPPSIPTGLSGTAVTSSQVNLAWAPSTDTNGIAGYDVYRGTTLLGSTPGTTTTFTDHSAVPATVNTYTVVARDGVGNASPASAPAHVTTPPAPAGPALAASAGATETAAATSLTATFPGPTAAGDLLVLSASEYNGTSNHITSVTDSAGNNWTRVNAFAVAGHNSNGEMWYSANALPTTIVTVHNASAVSMSLAVQAFTGVATTNALDASGGAAGTGTSAASGPASSTVTHELAVGFVAGHANTQPIIVTSPGYTTQAQQTTTGIVASVVTGFQVLGAPGVQSFSGSFTKAMYWSSGIAIFRPAS